jgi:Tfp pilus assembly protein PilO
LEFGILNLEFKFSMASTTLSNKSTAYALLAIVGTIILYLFGFNRGLTLLREASLQKAANESKISALQTKLADLRRLEQQFKVEKAQVDVLAVAMPADKQLAEIVTMMETMAARATVVLQSLQPTDLTQEGLTMAVTVQGSFGGILTFTELMEKNIRPIRLGPLNIASGGEILAATFDVLIPYQVSASEITPEAVPTEEGI